MTPPNRVGKSLLFAIFLVLFSACATRPQKPIEMPEPPRYEGKVTPIEVPINPAYGPVTSKYSIKAKIQALGSRKKLFCP